MKSVLLLFTIVTTCSTVLASLNLDPVVHDADYERPVYGSDPVGRNYTLIDACPIIDTAAGLTGTEYYKAVVQADGRNSVGFALTAMYHHNYRGSKSLEHMKAFAEAASHFVGAAYGLREISSSEHCLLVAKALLAVNGESIKYRTVAIPGPGYGQPLNGEAELQCQVKRRGQALYVAGQVGADHAADDAPEQDFYLGLLISLVKDVTLLQGITAANLVTEECGKVALDLGMTIREIFRTVHSDRIIRDAFGLNAYQRFQHKLMID
ncbi:hypothetical protein RvY_11977 [Ramazzottius varieornatus]|uniref:Uncharacterized protein n=1 Tax=Ramazzottius varieornatus TaxID=947166 RepID=A0A1D1VKB8_RAMVA|nr:hypothetical protein RvY_11977 [Ramazzottius varieornatus]